jgi:tRNA(fMet)-specific endonuclease VapC
MPYLLDTNSWIHYLKHVNSPIRAKLQTLQPVDIVSCSVVRAELLHGAEKYGNRDRRVATVVQTLAPFRSFAFNDEAASRHAQLRHSLEVAGLTIGPYDLQIAAICQRHQLILVTNNTSEFARVNGLQLEDWLQTP